MLCKCSSFYRLLPSPAATMRATCTVRICKEGAVELLNVFLRSNYSVLLAVMSITEAVSVPNCCDYHVLM